MTTTLAIRKSIKDASHRNSILLNQFRKCRVEKALQDASDALTAHEKRLTEIAAAIRDFANAIVRTDGIDEVLCACATLEALADELDTTDVDNWENKP